MDDDQFDLYEGLENFEDSAHSESELAEQVEKSVVSEDEDDFNLVVDDEDSTPQQQEVKSVKRTKPSLYTRKYRIFFVGAPGATQESPINKIEFFVLLKNLPIWLDNSGLLDYVKNVTSGVVFAKVLYNLYDGTPLGIALLEFSEISSCSTFLKHKSHISSFPMPLQVYTHLSSQYRHGVVSESLIKSACKFLSVPYTSSSSFCTSQQDMIEIEYERQQEELVKNGEFEIVTKTFPWFSYDLISIMGGCNRMMTPTSPGKSRRSKLSSTSNKMPPGFSPISASKLNAFHGSGGKSQASGANSRSSSASSSVHLDSYLSGGNLDSLGDKVGVLIPSSKANSDGKVENVSNVRESASRADSTSKHESSASRDASSKHELSSKYNSNRPGSSRDHDNRSTDLHRSSSAGGKPVAKSGIDKDHASSSGRAKSVKGRDLSGKRSHAQVRSDRSLDRSDKHKSRRNRSSDRTDKRDKSKKRDKYRHDRSSHRKSDKIH